MKPENKDIRDAIFGHKDPGAKAKAKDHVVALFNAAPDKAAKEQVADDYGVKYGSVLNWPGAVKPAKAKTGEKTDVIDGTPSPTYDKPAEDKAALTGGSEVSHGGTPEQIEPTSPHGEVAVIPKVSLARYKTYADLVKGFRAGTWLRVRIAGLVETKFGEAKLAEFAADTGTAVHTIENYRSVDRAYPMDDYGLVPAFTVGVAKVFMRVDKDERAGLVSQEWTVETAADKVKQLKAAGAKPAPEDLEAVLKAAEVGSSLSSIAKLAQVHRDVTKAALAELVEAGKVETWEQENGHKRYCLPGKAPEQPPDGPHSGYFAGGESGGEQHFDDLVRDIGHAVTATFTDGEHAAITQRANRRDMTVEQYVHDTSLGMIWPDRGV